MSISCVIIRYVLVYILERIKYFREHNSVGIDNTL